MQSEIDDSTWIKINNNIQYCNIQPYDTSLDFEGYFQDVEPSQQNFYITISPYAASIAFLYKQQNALQESQHAGFRDMKRHVFVFRTTGDLLYKFEINDPEDVIAVEFIQTGHLVVVYQNALVHIYTQRGLLIKSFKLVKDVHTQTHVIKYSITPDEICVVFSDMSIVYCENLRRCLYNSKQVKIESTRYQPEQFEADDPVQQLRCVQLIPRHYIQNPSKVQQPVLVSIVQNAQQEVFINFNFLYDATHHSIPFLTLQREEQTDISPTACLFDNIKLHNQLPLLLCQTYSQESNLAVINVQPYIDNDSQPILELSHNLLIYEDFPFGFCQEFPCFYSSIYNTLYLIFPTRAGTKEKELAVSSLIALQQQCDGIAFYTTEQQCCFNKISSISKELMSILREGEDTNKLLQAYSNYKMAVTDSSKITQSDFLLKQVANKAQSVQELLKTALLANRVEDCAYILCAATYVKLYVETEQQYETTRLYDKARYLLRATNDLLRNNQKIVMSVAEAAQELDDAPDRLLTNMCSMGYYDNAEKLAKFLKIESSYLKDIYVQKCICVVLDPKNQFVPDEELFQLIQHDATRCPGVFRQCADFLSRSTERYDLVSLFIEREVDVEDQVRLFMDTKDFKRAVTKAYEAGSEELVIEALREGMVAKSRLEILQTLIVSQNNQDTPGQSPSLSDQRLSQYIIELLYQQVVQYYKETQVLQNLSKPNILQDEDNINDICAITGDDQLKYNFLIVKYNVRQKKKHQQEFEALNELHADRTLSDTGQQIVDYILSHPRIAQISKQFNINDLEQLTMVQTLKLFGQEAVKLLLSTAPQGQDTLFKQSNSQLLVEAKGFMAKNKGADLTEGQMVQLVSYGIIEGILVYSQNIAENMKKWAVKTGITLLEDYYASMSKGIQKAIAGPVMQYLAVKCGKIYSNQSFNGQLSQFSDKRDCLKAGFYTQDANLVAKARDSMYENQILVLARLSITKEFRDKVLGK